MMSRFPKYTAITGFLAILLLAACARHEAPKTAEGAGTTSQPTLAGNFPVESHGQKSAAMPQTDSHAAKPEGHASAPAASTTQAEEHPHAGTVKPATPTAPPEHKP